MTDDEMKDIKAMSFVLDYKTVNIPYIGIKWIKKTISIPYIYAVWHTIKVWGHTVGWWPSFHIGWRKVTISIPVPVVMYYTVWLPYLKWKDGVTLKDNVFIYDNGNTFPKADPNTPQYMATQSVGNPYPGIYPDKISYRFNGYKTIIGAGKFFVGGTMCILGYAYFPAIFLGRSLMISGIDDIIDDLHEPLFVPVNNNPDPLETLNNNNGDNQWIKTN